ncbi:dienelactone hydrolase [Streptomyces rimosus subsp. rimosus]|uniref:Dienelactone hydrolase n=2 Tax=Streptomyces rimosus subsp. rimosus TaxID=132474 RepID=A0A8A1ULY9_STRR1|nr:dienelactone hydrolase [Kitasatospora aureofaciens]KOT28683.1 dienelactone hydrolase [Streptomyces rimosus subsp. rimosus]KOT28713.1 dienelactone hydrolase [Streptomyces sp. NRRL WC-3701]MYT43913.1 dienelactone hydrolase [Streptomyces sp. SID5471]QDA07448.1 dienelactone hydrolase [Streptomyces rimosus]QGY70148.1 dienelactone hydrolase [Streptomyces rimosus R6-500]QST80521.1 dienelactone hydrolase [Streptomyces rimosus subsp. rimosus ATCC 10970]RSO06438.1 dienelactone hydrolase [Streptomyc
MVKVRFNDREVNSVASSPASPSAPSAKPSTVVLFHSVCGLRPAVHAAADRLREAGHEVVVPDLFGGRTAETVEDGVVIKDEIGKDELLRRAVVAVAPYSDRGVVYAGFSFGGAVAQNLALADDKARGLLLMHGTSDIADDAAVDELPVQLHVADPDPFEPHDWLNAWYLRMGRAGADVEVYRYQGAGHLFTDPDLPDYDAEAAESAWKVALGFLDSL